MSRVGNKLLLVESPVDVTLDGQNVTFKGPKGQLSCFVDPVISVVLESNELKLVRKSEKKEVKAKHGLYRSLLSNNYEGVLNGFEKSLQLVGIGYRVQLKGKNLEFSIGYSHPILFESVEGIEFEVEGQDKLKVKGIDKQLVGEVCARIKRLRKRDAYKGKGIHFVGDVIRKKPGKSVKK